MIKIFNSPKTNTYGGISMVGKYIFMSRRYVDYTEYFIYKIDEIYKDSFPSIYKSQRSYKLVVFKDPNKKIDLVDHLTGIELNAQDTLYEITINDFMKYLKIMIDYDAKKSKFFNINDFN